MRELHLAQLKRLLEAADKRDAQHHLHQMQDFHVSIAPLLVGDEAKEILESRKKMLRDIIDGKAAVKKKDTVFARMWALATGSDKGTNK